MRTEHKLGLGGLGFLLLPASCATTSPRGDYSTVGALSRNAPTAAAENDLRGATSTDARALLAQPLSADRAVRIELDLRRPTDRTLPLQKEVMVEYDLTDAILAPMRARAARADLEATALSGRRRSVAGAADPMRMKQDGIDPSSGRKKGN